MMIALTVPVHREGHRRAAIYNKTMKLEYSDGP